MNTQSLTQAIQIQIMEYMDNFTFSLIFCYLPEYKIEEYKQYTQMTYLHSFPTKDSIFNIEWILYLIDTSRSDILHFYFIDCKCQYPPNELLFLILLYGDEKLVNYFIESELFDILMWHEYEYRLDSYYYGLELFALRIRNGFNLDEKYLYMDFFRMNMDRHIFQLFKTYKPIYKKLPMLYFHVIQEKYKHFVNENFHVQWLYYFDKNKYLHHTIFPREEMKNEEEERFS